MNGNLSDEQVKAQYPIGTKVQHVERKRAGIIKSYHDGNDPKGPTLLVRVRWEDGRIAWLRPERLRPI